MLISLILELKNKKKQEKENLNKKESKEKEKEIKNKKNIEKDSENLNKKTKDNLEDNKKQEKTDLSETSFKRKKKKDDKLGLFHKRKKEPKIFLSAFQLLFVFIIVIVLFAKIVSYNFSKIYPISGELKEYSDTKVVFVPDITTLYKKDTTVKNLEVSDIVYFKYDSVFDKWVISDSKKGLKAEVIYKNNYLYKFTILNLKNIVIDKSLLSSFGNSTSGRVTLNLKRSFKTYSVSFEFNDFINSLRKKLAVKDYDLMDIVKDVLKESH